MRWILFLGVLLVCFCLLCGCIRSSQAPPATIQPAPAGVTVPDTTPTPDLPIAVNISARQTQDSVIVRVDGGRDAGSLVSLAVRIMNYDGTTVQRTIGAPETGKDYSIQYYHTANARTINVVGTFSDGRQQTLLISSL